MVGCLEFGGLEWLSQGLGRFATELLWMAVVLVVDECSCCVLAHALTKV